MKNYKRILDLSELTKKKSHFLFGPRGTGKSFLIHESFNSEVLIINLLKSEDFLDLHLNPEGIRQRIEPKKNRIVVIDEIQRIPQLLNEIHYLIEKYKIHFLLTGSSVRRLKAPGTNMLGGRARMAQLFPLSFTEISDFNLEKYLRFGGLPAVLNSDEPREDLSAYLVSYLNEEIKMEASVRKIDFFHRFLETAALFSSDLVTYSNIASDVGVSEPTVKSYYQILEDTLIGFQLFPWKKGKSRKSISSSKFYFFDTGVLHTILRSPDILDRNSDMFGKTFEQFIAQEIRAYLSYRRMDISFHFWRSLEKVEVDFIVADQIAIEVKSSRKVKKDHLDGLKKIAAEGSFRLRILVTNDPIERNVDGIQCLHWKSFLARLWGDEIDFK